MYSTFPVVVIYEGEVYPGRPGVVVVGVDRAVGRDVGRSRVDSDVLEVVLLD